MQSAIRMNLLQTLCGALYAVILHKVLDGNVIIGNTET